MNCSLYLSVTCHGHRVSLYPQRPAENRAARPCDRWDRFIMQMSCGDRGFYYWRHWTRRTHTESLSSQKQSGFALDIVQQQTARMCNMTFEETGGDNSSERMDSVAKALEEVLSSALPQGCITVGVYEAAKSLNADPDNVVLCLLATDDDEEDVALQIHFTLIQAFCCENDINILRVSNTRRLAEILGGVKPGGEPMDLHCVLVTNPQSSPWKDHALSKVNRFCRDSRCLDQWVPVINLPDR
ncbi:growth arrest and DNA-damage-inducible, alpha, b [Morone saxatilis]|uniref:growth arrest and DNA-damage-inducible, alpha, b n=1 Tax=Morone saxatilis TaxID=34816 RepID=UPI0015E23B08|nr:growth arrest and DNA-damage-inducible, alpha, b [Morone saxatilis]